MTAISIEKQLQNIPKHFPVVVLMQQQPSTVSRWSEYYWDAIGVMLRTNVGAMNGYPQLIREEGDTRQYLYGGFNVHLHIDECESYYYNLISPTPRCYVIARNNEDNIPIPFLVSMSFDEAHAYMETDDLVYAVDVPPELYRWTEDFVLMHYTPEQRKKRKREDWKNQHQQERTGE